MIGRLAFLLAGVWVVVSEEVNLCRGREGNFSLLSNGYPVKFKLLKLQDDNCAADVNILLLKLQRVHCVSTSQLLIKEFPIEKEICKHGTGRCFVFTTATAEDGLMQGLPFQGCKHIHWLDSMSKITVRLSFTYHKFADDGVDFSYHFTQRPIAQEADDEVTNTKPDTLKMDVVVLVLIILVATLALVTIVVTARMCYMSRKNNGMKKLSDTAHDAVTHDGNNISNVSNGALLQEERQVIPNRLYDEARHVYEDEAF